MVCALLAWTGAQAQGTAPDEPALAAVESTTLAALQREAPATRWNPELTTSRSNITPPGPPALAADGRRLDEVIGLHARVWHWRGRLGLGLGVGTLGYAQLAPLAAAPGEAAAGLAGAAPMVSLGMRYRMGRESAVFADALGARAVPPDTGGAYVSGKVGLEWKPATSRLGIDGGALGLHFDSGYRLSLKARRGGFGVYLRGQF